MGCRVTRTNEGICITGPAACAESAGVKSADAGSETASGSASHASHASGRLHGLTVDMSSCSDQAITLAAIAPFADSPVTITGIGHIRGQESDRLSAITENLTAMGIRCDERADSITIYPGVPKPAHIKPMTIIDSPWALPLPACLQRALSLKTLPAVRRPLRNSLNAWKRLWKSAEVVRIF